jgi:hypothetical protein
MRLINDFRGTFLQLFGPFEAEIKALHGLATHAFLLIMTAAFDESCSALKVEEKQCCAVGHSKNEIRPFSCMIHCQNYKIHYFGKINMIFALSSPIHRNKMGALKLIWLA